MKEVLKLRIEDAAWKSATSVIKHLLDIGKIEKAKNHIRQVIENWRLDGKLDTINDFKEWIVKNDIKNLLDISEF